MKTKKDGPPRAFDRYYDEEIELILSVTPTYANVRILAKSLGRSEEAIWTIYELAYSRKWLKGQLKRFGPDQDNVMTKISRAKKKIGIIVGYKPK